MTTIHKFGNQFIAIVKGAAESITDKLESNASNDDIQQQTDKLASEGKRVLAYGYRLMETVPGQLKIDDIERDLVFAGLVGMIDPPREEVKAAIKECITAGIHTVMITGDHKETASAIAREIGILTPNDLVLTGSELAALSPEELDDKVEKIRVYARVSPEQKLNIVKSLQRKKHLLES